MRLDGASEHITPYDKLAFSDVEAQAFLASGEHRTELTAFFGEREYGELQYLARSAVEASAKASAGRVLIIPGIMGSQLGFDRTPPLPRDLLWVDPADIGAGRLRALRMGAAPVRAMGVVLHSYLRLRLRLAAHGFDVGCVDYDWRLGIDVLGKQLAQRIEAEPHASVHVVAHSMGALVSRAALALPVRRKVRQVVLLGSPNEGSFAGVQAVRGTYPVVRKLARLDSHSSAETLAEEVFNTFPSLYHLLPTPSCTPPAIDLFDVEQWPRQGPRPRADLLDAARGSLVGLAKATDRFSVVVGTAQPTVTGIERDADDFIYTVTQHGDGTVPVASARLEGADNYYIACAHSELTRDPLVAIAVVDILKTGATRRLERRWSPRNRAQGRISDSALRLTNTEKLDLTTLDPDARRQFMQTLNEPPPLRLRPPGR